MRTLVAVLLLAAACTSSLSTKQDYISNYEAWVKNLKANYKAYKKADWSTAEANFKRYSERTDGFTKGRSVTSNDVYDLGSGNVIIPAERMWVLELVK